MATNRVPSACSQHKILVKDDELDALVKHPSNAEAKANIRLAKIQLLSWPLVWFLQLAYKFETIGECSKVGVAGFLIDVTVLVGLLLNRTAVLRGKVVVLVRAEKEETRIVEVGGISEPSELLMRRPDWDKQKLVRKGAEMKSSCIWLKLVNLDRLFWNRRGRGFFK